jgi:hypothetical protein
MCVANGIKRLFACLSIFLFASICYADGWGGIRTSGPGTAGWQALVCANGNGWQSCEMPVNIALASNPAALVANGEQATITATVTDYYGVPIAGATLNWTTSSGSIWPAQTVTNAGGVSSITLASSNVLGGAAVNATTLEQDGTAGIWVPFIDKWVPTASAYTGFSNYGGPYSCTALTPDPSTVDAGVGYWPSQNCWQAQIRYRQDQEVSVVTWTVRPVGGPVAEFQYIVITQYQYAVGTKVTTPPTPPAPVCSYASGVTWFESYEPNGAKRFWENGVFVEGPQTTYVHDREVWTGYIDYNGYRYTSGPFVSWHNQGRNFEIYEFYLCKAPL